MNNDVTINIDNRVDLDPTTILQLIIAALRQGGKFASYVLGARAGDANFIIVLDKIAGIEELDISLRTANALRKANIKTISDLMGKTAHQIFQMPGVGPARFLEVQDALRRRGWHLAR